MVREHTCLCILSLTGLVENALVDALDEPRKGAVVERLGEGVAAVVGLVGGCGRLGLLFIAIRKTSKDPACVRCRG